MATWQGSRFTWRPGRKCQPSGGRLRTWSCSGFWPLSSKNIQQGSSFGPKKSAGKAARSLALMGCSGSRDPIAPQCLWKASSSSSAAHSSLNKWKHTNGRGWIRSLCLVMDTMWVKMGRQWAPFLTLLSLAINSYYCWNKQFFLILISISWTESKHDVLKQTMIMITNLEDLTGVRVMPTKTITSASPTTWQLWGINSHRSRIRPHDFMWQNIVKPWVP